MQTRKTTQSCAMKYFCVKSPLFVFLLLVNCKEIPASGKIDMNEYDYLVNIEINVNKANGKFAVPEIEIEMPYTKPAGINFVPTLDRTGVIIHSIFIDGKHLKPKQSKVPMFMSGFFLFDTAYREPPGLHDEETIYDEENRAIKMKWVLVNDKEKIFIKHENITENWVKPKYFRIEKGKREVIIEYDIFFMRFNSATNEHKKIKLMLHWIADTVSVYNVDRH